jgi:hypothetical protein
VDQSLEAEGTRRGHRPLDGEGRVSNGRGARAADEAGRLQEAGSPWTGRTLDVVAGWNKPVEPGPEQTAERLRKSEGGT